MTPDAPKPWPDVLAAYADGELGPADHAEVKRRLCADPAARSDLDGQRQLSPENWRLWQRAEPPLPTDDTWASVGAAVAGALQAPHQPARGPRWGRRAGPWLGVVVGTAVAASVLAIVGGVIAPQSPPVAVEGPADDPLAGYAVLPVAADDDVEVHRVAGAEVGWLPVGAHPLPERFVLAAAGDIELEAVTPAGVWPPGGPQITPQAGDAPMLFAAPPR